jgi:hypothetical protein
MGTLPWPSRQMPAQISGPKVPNLPINDHVMKLSSVIGVRAEDAETAGQPRGEHGNVPFIGDTWRLDRQGLTRSHDASRRHYNLPAGHYYCLLAINLGTTAHSVSTEEQP